MKCKKHVFSTFWKYKDTVYLALISIFLLVSLTYKFYIASYFALVPVLFIIYQKDLKTAVISCALVGLISSLFGFDWVYHYDLSLYILTVIVWMLFLIIFSATVHFFYHRLKFFSLFIAPIIWVWFMLILDFTKYGSYIFEFSMYNSLTAPLIWLIGGRGMTFIMITLNSLIAGILIKKTKKRLFTLALIALILISCYFYSNFGEASGESFKVMLAQGNFAKTWGWRQGHVEEIFDSYEELSQDKESKDIIIWPEYTLPVDTTFRPQIFEGLQSIAKNNQAYFITGSIIYDQKSGDHYDAALLFNQNGELIDNYKSVYPAFYNKNTLKGDEGVKLFLVKEKKAGIMICAEETDSKIARVQAKKGAQFLISLSNNQDLGRGIYLSRLYSMLRAAENYKYLIRATNTGVTQIINPYGKTEHMLEENERKILIGEIRLNEHKTPYTLYGDIPLYALTLLGVVFAKKRRFV